MRRRLLTSSAEEGFVYLLLKGEDGGHASINRIREARLCLITDGDHSVAASR